MSEDLQRELEEIEQEELRAEAEAAARAAWVAVLEGKGEDLPENRVLADRKTSERTMLQVLKNLDLEASAPPAVVDAVAPVMTPRPKPLLLPPSRRRMLLLPSTFLPKLGSRARCCLIASARNWALTSST